MSYSIKKLILGLILFLFPAMVLASAIETGAKGEEKYIQIAQASDPRVSQLEEQIRNMTGKLEESNFQIFQMQEQIRKMQEDNEFRFQALEKKQKPEKVQESEKKQQPEKAQDLKKNKHSDAGGIQNTTLASTTHDTHWRENPLKISQDHFLISAISSTFGQDSVPEGYQQDVSIHTMHLNTHDSSIGVMNNEDMGARSAVLKDGDRMASLLQINDPKEHYQIAYQYVLAGDYPSAEIAFRQYISRFPTDSDLADAQFWLGETLYAQERYPEAATVFIDRYRDFPQAKHGAENLLKLGMALSKMHDHDVSCATFAQISVRYPDAVPAILKKATDERAKNHC